MNKAKTKDLSMAIDGNNTLEGQMLSQFGPVIGGRDLYAALGFKTPGAFRWSRERGEIPVRIFSLPRRRGSFAFTSEVAGWLIVQAGT